ncbi:hypothetical protein HUO13_11195 [Saccharopolyspora erythraea]|uniref:hypothetical protein n=1 Tax=Saccharopolyspora erythraea TaxID=1836 RepID=UPI001BA4A3A7|nr:hypothetical protein [Saccharopolyspora erythraea]QUH01292.1 hypothetical protein HUO13_11195 [Saccharopolyspora erythraea]
MSTVAAGALTSAGLVGGFAVAQATRHRYWGGVVAAGAGLGAMRICHRNAGLGRALLLGGSYAAALAGSHPLAKKVGAWPSVFTVTAATAVAAGVLARKR